MGKPLLHLTSSAGDTSSSGQGMEVSCPLLHPGLAQAG